MILLDIKFDFTINVNTVVGTIVAGIVLWSFNFIIRAINRQIRQHKLLSMNLEAMNYGLENINGNFKAFGDDYRKKRNEKFDELKERDEFLSKDIDKGTIGKL